MLTRILADSYAEILDRTSPEQYGVEDTTLFRSGLAEMYHQLGMEDRARDYWTIQRNHLAHYKNPNFQSDIDITLALSCAGLGLNEEAVQLARDALTDDPLSVDAVLGTFRMEMAALVFVRAGEYEEAIDQLEVLLSVPSWMSRTLLRIDPAWDPLRQNPRFRKLVEKER
jgi:serine/threonine-protein kinase